MTMTRNRQSQRGIITAAAVFAPVLFLAACATPGPAPKPPALDYAQEAPHRFAVKGPIEVVEAFHNDVAPPHVEYKYGVTPASVAQDWAQKRLAAAGGPGNLRVVIEEAEVVAEPLETKRGVTGAFYDEPELRLVGRLTVRLDYTTKDQSASARAQAFATRSILESATLNERDAAYYKVIEDLSKVFTEQIEQELARSFGAAYLGSG